MTLPYQTDLPFIYKQKLYSYYLGYLLMGLFIFKYMFYAVLLVIWFRYIYHCIYGLQEKVNEFEVRHYIQK